MPEIDKHKPGAFAWIELSTTDQKGAKAFYSSLFGWTFQDSPMGPDDVYTMFSLNGNVCSAVYTIRGDELAMGVPSHWNLYIAVESADDTAKLAGELGAKVLAPPFDVSTYGRMAVLQDPTGAVFSLWQSRTHTGIAVKDEPGSFCWADLNTPNPAAASTFYSKLFGWEVEPGQDGSGYLHIKNAEDYIGGIPPAEHRNPNAPPHWMIYTQVADCGASTEKAKELGARVYMGPMTMEKVGTITVFADPAGAVSALFESQRS
jgi:predicted enzyme related to lactoylglutathione lyase